MKTLKPLFVLATCFILVSTACQKNGESPLLSRAKGTGTGTFTLAGNIEFKVNGAARKYTTVMATYYPSAGTLQIIGSDGTQAVSLMVEKVKVGTFDVANNEVIGTYSTKSDYNNTYISTTGKVVIAKFTADAVAGTFQFFGNTPSQQTAAISEGTFSAKMITI